jgi:endoglucanase
MKIPASGQKKKRPDALQMRDLLKTLTQVWGPAGFEHEVRGQIRRIVEPYADEIRVDALGNLLCRVGSGGKRVMVSAHMDEIGVIATFVEKKTGFVRFSPLGGLLNTALLGTRVRFENGVIGTLCMPEYFSAARTTAPALDQYYIDVSGADPVEPGMAAAFDREAIDRGSRIVGKAMDDRAGCAVAIEAMRRLNRRVKNETWFVFSVQEEVGIRGARTAAFGVQPEIGIALDVTPSGDMLQVERNDVTLGKGAAIKIHDVGLIVPPAVRDWMVQRAEKDGIAFQRELISLGTTDGAAIQVAHAGVPTGAISIPCRYVHTTSETVDEADMEACIELLAALVANPITL